MPRSPPLVISTEICFNDASGGGEYDGSGNDMVSSGGDGHSGDRGDRRCDNSNSK